MRLNPPDSGYRIRVEGYSRLLQEVANGSLDGLQCPECHQQSVSVCFSPHRPNEYRSWLICTSCDFKVRLQNAAKSPPVVQPQPPQPSKKRAFSLWSR